MKAFQAAAIACLISGSAHAYCASGNPLDVRCTPQDFLAPTFGQSAWYSQNQVATRGMIYDCAHPYARGVAPPPVQWCAAARAALRSQSRGSYRGW